MGSATTTAGGRGKCTVSGGAEEGAGKVPTLGKLEDRNVWALLAREAVHLGECRAAAEYLAAAQRHNDAFRDRDNVARCAIWLA